MSKEATLIEIDQHPCFNADKRHTTARIHLPVAPRCNIQCNYCSREFDCVNESRPGVTSSVLTPEQALIYLSNIKDKLPSLAVVGIAGPGDPFANPSETMETLRLVRSNFPELILCLSTNGLGIAPYIDELADLKVSHVTITINALDPTILENIYSYVRYDKRLRKGVDGVSILIKKQLEAVKLLSEKGVIVKVNSIILPGINDEHIWEVAKRTSALGATIMNAIPYYPVKEAVFSELEAPQPKMVQIVRADAEEYIPQMNHCQRCRADAAGLLGEDMTDTIVKEMEKAIEISERRTTDISFEQKPYIAVASMEGVMVNEHLGEAKELKLYGWDSEKSKPYLVESREMPLVGGGDSRWQEMAEKLLDCSLVLVTGVGSSPVEVLAQYDIKVLEIEGIIEDVLTKLYQKKSIEHLLKKHKSVCGQACAGKGDGCG